MPADLAPSGAVPSLAAALPFAGLILSIAVLPQAAPAFWARRKGTVATCWALAAVVPLALTRGDGVLRGAAVALLADYLPFIAVIWALYAVTGGILIRGGLSGSPRSNTALLGAGSLLASLVGTTGAAMLLVRPLLRANAWRRHRAHQVVFFIFLVCNIGGSLLPLGDPPLLLGFLHGVPFFWNLRLLPAAGTATALLLACFWALDRRAARGDPPAPAAAPLAIRGGANFALLAVIVTAVAASGAVDLGTARAAGVERPVAGLVRDLVVMGAGLLSLGVTPAGIREENRFSWGPVREVALIFPGIFVAAVPVLMLLREGAEGRLGWVGGTLNSPVAYFWASGALSSVLDNTPTYLIFFSAALGDLCCGMTEKAAVASFLRDQGIFLKAIAAGTVFMGANTYLGNGPNLLVRSVAEEERVEMPGFFGYILRYTVVFLLPTFLVVSAVLFAP